MHGPRRALALPAAEEREPATRAALCTPRAALRTRQWYVRGTTRRRHRSSWRPALELAARCAAEKQTKAPGRSSLRPPSPATQPHPPPKPVNLRSNSRNAIICNLTHKRMACSSIGWRRVHTNTFARATRTRASQRAPVSARQSRWLGPVGRSGCQALGLAGGRGLWPAAR